MKERHEMLEFERWCKEQIPESFDTKEIGIEERGMKKGWKAALEWVSSEFCKTDSYVEYRIRKELAAKPTNFVEE